MKLKRELPKWMCPYCAKPVGYVGNFLAKVFGTRIHSCDSSNVVEPPKVIKVPEPQAPYPVDSLKILKELEEYTEEYWNAASVDPQMDRLLVKLSVIYQILRFEVIPDLEKKLKDLDNEPKS